MLVTIQAYRGIAAILVAAYHLSIAFSDPRYLGTEVLAGITWRMNLGVDFFFVLSGYIIMMAHQSDIGQPQRLAPFLMKRFVRLYPVYWIYIATYCALLALGAGTVSQMPATEARWFSTFSLIRLDNFLLPISPAWTLFHEVAFYAVFSLLILHRFFGLAAFVAWQAACLWFFQYPPESGRTPFAVYFAAYNFDFAIGMLVAIIIQRRLLPLPSVWLVAGLALLIGTLVVETKIKSFRAYPLLYALAFGAIIVGSVFWEKRRSPFEWPLLSFLGAASYSIYLTHLPLEGLLLKMATRTGLLQRIDEHVIYVAVLIGAIALGAAAYVLIERPLLALCRRLIDRRDRTPPAEIQRQSALR